MSFSKKAHTSHVDYSIWTYFWNSEINIRQSETEAHAWQNMVCNHLLVKIKISYILQFLPLEYGDGTKALQTKAAEIPVSLWGNSQKRRPALWSNWLIFWNSKYFSNFGKNKWLKKSNVSQCLIQLPRVRHYGNNRKVNWPANCESNASWKFSIHGVLIRKWSWFQWQPVSQCSQPRTF